MPFRFVHVCDLLDVLEKPFLRNVPFLARDLAGHNRRHIIGWFKQHKRNLDHFNTSPEVVLSMLQPDKQTDRDYGLDKDALERIIARVLGLSRQQYSELQKWRESAHDGDFAACVGQVIDSMGHNPLKSMTNAINAEEIDQALLRIASFSSGSSALVRSLSRTWGYADEVELLGNLYRRLQGREAKWLTRLILKSFAPVKFPDDLSFTSDHSSLPSCLSVNVQFPTPASSAVRIEGTSIIKGSKTPRTLFLVPTSSSTAPVSTPSASVARRRSPRTPPTSPPLPESSAAMSAQINSSQHILYSSTPTVEKLPRCSTTSAGSALGPIFQSSQNSQQRNSGSSQCSAKSNSQYVTTGTGVCRFALTSCHFKNKIFIPSPCISRSPYIVTELLLAHGAHFVTSLAALSCRRLPGRNDQSGKRYRKIVLVESRNTERTAQFVQKVMKLGLKRKGKREEIEVYDWRLLECIAKLDGGRKLNYDPWERCWMLAV